MNTTPVVIITASVLAFSTLAQQTLEPKTDPQSLTADRLPHGVRSARLNAAAKSSDIMGMKVRNYQGEALGKVEELLLDMESGRIVQVILSSGGFIGIGDTLTAVPPGAFHHDVAGKVLHLDADKAKLKGAPKFEMEKLAEHSDSEHLAEVYRYYGEAPSYTFVHRGETDLEGKRSPDSTPDILTTPRTEGKEQALDGRSYTIPASRLSQIQRASKVIGSTVKNLQDEKLGQVDNMLLDMPSGHVVAVIVSSGGFLGLGDELSAVPPVALRFTPDREMLVLDASKEMLSKAPHFKANQWPDFAQPTYSAEIYRAYNVEPYFTTNLNVRADNTARSVRDRNASTLTPLDQGNGASDVNITAQIRKGIRGEKDMSVNAQNVKIITNNGQVTLRGPVDSAEEKRLIGDIAIHVALLANVDNQLEVK